jgi:hypothetical protein
VRFQESESCLDSKSSDRWGDARRYKSFMGDQGGDFWCDAKI